MSKKEKEDCPQDYTGLCIKVAKLEVKMNILAFVSGATFVAVITTLLKILTS